MNDIIKNHKGIIINHLIIHKICSQTTSYQLDDISMKLFGLSNLSEIKKNMASEKMKRLVYKHYFFRPMENSFGNAFSSSNTGMKLFWQNPINYMNQKALTKPRRHKNVKNSPENEVGKDLNNRTYFLWRKISG